VDVRAGREQFTLVARRCLPRAQFWVIVFEPLPTAAAKLRNVFAGDDRVTLHEASIGLAPGNAIIHISRRDDSSSRLPIAATQVAMFPGTSEQTPTVFSAYCRSSFQCRTYCPCLSQDGRAGFRLEVLRGCEILFDRFACVYAKCSFVELYIGHALANELIDWQHERGFMFRGVHNTGYGHDGLAIQGDFLFSSCLLPIIRESD